MKEKVSSGFASNAGSWNYGEGTRLVDFRHVRIKGGTKIWGPGCIAQRQISKIAAAPEAAPTEHHGEIFFKAIIRAPSTKGVKQRLHLREGDGFTLYLEL